MKIMMIHTIKLIICLHFLTAFLNISLYSQSVTEDMRLNQLGFYPHAPKLAILVTDSSSDVFYITSPDGKKIVYKSSLSKLRKSNNSSLKTRTADFSQLNTGGDYCIFVPGKGYSHPFTVSKEVFHGAAVAALKGFYYQRASIPLEKKYAGKWERPAGHADTSVIIHSSAATKQRPEGTVASSPGGWYDAGDYNKYVVNSGITMGTLLSAYEDFPSFFTSLRTNIPEIAGDLPDILNEVLYNLRWMLTMQDPYDGGVYHKCTNASFDGMVMPGITKLPRYLVQKGTAAALDFAAVTAQASRIFKKYKLQLPGLSDSCLKASIRAWQWAKKNPDLPYNQDALNAKFKPKITTGAYGDRNFRDEKFWAASELLATTQNESYFQVLFKGMNDSISLPNWSNVFLLGYYTLSRYGKKFSARHGKEIQMIKQRVVQFANTYLQHVDDNAFQTVIGQSKKDFNWGSNSNAANQGILLINAYLITKRKIYVDAALTNLDYILGRNATGYCFVTGLGWKSPKHPHHRPSVADTVEEPVPGLMTGGPNPGRQDGCIYYFFDPETAYLDSSCAYASNEIAINWNAPLVYLVSAIEALQYEIKYSDK